ncbi:hypothetical protein AB3N58_10415 [Leptospira sp. WS60.C2]
MKKTLIILTMLPMLSYCASYYENENVHSKIKEIENNKLPIIVKARASRPNSAGGVDFSVHWKNVSNNTFKYVVFTVIPYNAVGDIQKCSIRNYSEFKGKETGPYEPGSVVGYGTSWSNAWYNHSIRCVKLKKVEITFMDNTKTTITDIDKILDPNQEICPPKY